MRQFTTLKSPKFLLILLGALLLLATLGSTLFFLRPRNTLDDFVKKAGFPESQGVKVSINDQDQGLQVFSVTFGQPQDCPAGCAYSSATGMQYKKKIGWVAINNLGNTDTSKLPLYDFDASDSYLYTVEFFQLLEAKHESVYRSNFLPLLAEDKDVPRGVLIRIAKDLSTYTSPQIADRLLKNPATQTSRELLGILANLPVLQGDPYELPRSKAQELLRK